MRWLKQIGIRLGVGVVLLFLVVLAQSVDPKQDLTGESKQIFADTLATQSFSVDSLLNLVSAKHQLPRGFEIQTAIALSAFPELKDVPIVFVLTESGAPLEATFNLRTLFSKAEKRSYVINILDKEGTDFDPILLRNLPFDAQIGVLAHELGHVVYYHRLNLLQIGKWGLNYAFSNEFKALHERSTDMMPVTHGLGLQIYQYAYYVRNDPKCADLYSKHKEFADTYYMTDKELWKQLRK